MLLIERNYAIEKIEVVNMSLDTSEIFLLPKMHLEVSEEYDVRYACVQRMRPAKR